MIDKLIRLREQERQEATQRYLDKSKRALCEIAKKRCTTIFIGALDSIEQKFGYQWRPDKPADQLTEKEILFRQLWQTLRKEILDKSNFQVKQLIQEIDYFTVELNRNEVSGEIYE